MAGDTTLLDALVVDCKLVVELMKEALDGDTPELVDSDSVEEEEVEVALVCSAAYAAAGPYCGAPPGRLPCPP